MESVFESREQYLTMRNEWKAIVNDTDLRKQLTKEDMALYATLRRKDWRKCFAPTSSCDTIKDIEHYLIKSNYVNLLPYNKTVTTEMIDHLRINGIKTWDEV
jgi:hypothetical protein